MKKYIFLIFAAATAVFAACSSDEGTSAYPDKLEVVLTPTWDATRGMTSSSQTRTVAVTLNVESVHWTVSSDSDWCVVDEEESHVGSGEFTIEVTANEDFKSRDAIVTLSAGAFTYRMTVDQSGNIFILDKVYSVVAPNDSEAIEVVVKTLSKWQPVDSEWIHGEVVETSEPDAEGMTTSTLRIRCDANTGAAGRYGTLTIEPTDGVGYSTEYAVYQFGTDMPFGTDGKLGLAAKGEVKFDVVAPAEAVVGVTCPTWITYVSEPDGEQATYTFSVAENPSDTKTEREGVIEFSIKDIEAQTALPAIRQAFYPAGGIVSGAGLKMFAEAFNAGEDTSDWTSGEGGKTVEVLGDVDMKDVEWTSIGTAERPFDGVVAGNGHLIQNWNTSEPLFGHTAEGSEIRELTIDAASRVTARSVAAGEYAAALVGVCNGTLRNCSNMAAVTLDAAATVDGACGVGGLVGLVGATGRVENCSNGGLVTLGSGVVGNKVSIGGVAAETESGSVVSGCTNEGGIASSGATPKVNTAGLYTGGVVGYAGGAVENCTTEGGKTVALQIKAAYMSYTGGIAGWADGSVTGCTNKQPLSIAANRLGDACRYAYAGGVAGKSTGAISGSKNRGNLTATAVCKFVTLPDALRRTNRLVNFTADAAGHQQAVALPVKARMEHAAAAGAGNFRIGRLQCENGAGTHYRRAAFWADVAQSPHITSHHGLLFCRLKRRVSRFMVLFVEKNLIPGQQNQSAVWNQSLSPAPDHDDQRLAGNVQIADGTAYPRVLRLEGDLLKLNAAILPIGAGSQHQTVPAPQHRAAPGDQRFPAPLNSSHDDSLRQAQLADGPSGPRILLR